MATSETSNLKLDFPFKMDSDSDSDLFELLFLPIENPSRIEYTENIKKIIAIEPDFWDRVIMTDEAAFTLDGHVEIKITIPPAPKIIVWCGVCSNRIIGPYFFEDNGYLTKSVKQKQYMGMLRDFLANELEENGMTDFWFQQDGASYHTARKTIKLLRKMFPNRLISKSGDVNWPTSSSDLNPSEFFLWDYLRAKVYSNQLESMEELKAKICHEIAEISQETLSSDGKCGRKDPFMCGRKRRQFPKFASHCLKKKL